MYYVTTRVIHDCTVCSVGHCWCIERRYGQRNQPLLCYLCAILRETLQGDLEMAESRLDNAFASIEKEQATRYGLCDPTSLSADD